MNERNILVVVFEHVDEQRCMCSSGSRCARCMSVVCCRRCHWLTYAETCSTFSRTLEPAMPRGRSKTTNSLTFFSKSRVMA